MLQSIFDAIINNLPPDPSGALINTVVAIAVGIGALTALLGALHSRPTIAMMMFSVGTIAGFALPAWLGLNVDRSITIAAGGMIFGVVGFLLHRWCVALMLGVLVAAVATAVFYDQSQIAAPSPPSPSEQTVRPEATVQQIVMNSWETATPGFKKNAQWVALGAFVVSAVLAFFLPKFGMAALYSLGGTLLTLFAIGLGHSTPKITWLNSLKSGPMTVAALGITMLLVGFLAQIALVYRPATRRPDESEAGTAAHRQPDLG